MHFSPKTNQNTHLPLRWETGDTLAHQTERARWSSGKFSLTSATLTTPQQVTFSSWNRTFKRNILAHLRNPGFAELEAFLMLLSDRKGFPIVLFILGIFSAPVKGVYYFSISTFKYDKERNGCVSLFRNHERMLTACDHNSEDQSDSANNGAAIQLEKGDHVFITLHATSKVFDDYHNRSCFRGFLLFTL